MSRKQRRTQGRAGTVPTPRTASASIQAMLAEAVGHHQAGRLDQAERLYRQVLAVDPGHADSLHLLGVLANQVGRHDVAAELIGRAIAVDGRVAAYHSNLGNALKELGRPEEAAASWRRALALQPDHPAANNNLGLALREQGRLDEAAEHCRRAIAVRPDFAAAHNTLGGALQRLGQLAEAEECYRRAVALQPDYAEAWSNLGGVLEELGRPGEAAESCRRAVALAPGLAAAHNILGVALRDLGRPDAAAESCRCAIALAPDYAEARFNLGRALLDLGRLDAAAEAYGQAVAIRPDYVAACSDLGVVLRRQGRLDDAVACCRKAVSLDPDYAAAYSNLGVALREQGHLDEAVACCRKAIALEPDSAEAHSNLGLALLLGGEYAEGWREHGWRFQAETPPRPFPQPRWTGQDLRGRRLLVWGEQGVGDELVYFGLCAELLELGAAVVAECDPRLVDLLARSLPGIEVVARRDPPDPRCLDAEFQVPLEGAAALLRPSLDGFRPLRPYLVADAADTAGLRARYGGGGEMLVGIAWWTGNPERSSRSSIPLRRWLPVLAVPGVRFVSLQYGDHAAEIADACRAAGVSIVVDDGVDQFNDLDRLAAQVSAMDLVVAIDNSTALLGSALGRRVWCLVDTAPFWRMGLAGESSPWHPGLRLFRQRQRGEWADVLARVAGELRRMTPES